MQPSPPIARCLAILPVGAALLLSSCVSKPAAVVTPRSAGNDGVVLREGQYKETAVTGSHLPVLVSNSPTARRLPGANEVTIISPEAFQELVRRGDVASRR